MDDRVEDSKAAEGDATPGELLALLPEENPNPVMIATPDAALLYVNPAARQVPHLLADDASAIASNPLVEAVARAAKDRKPAEVNTTIADRIFVFEVHPSSGASHLNIYGRDITVRVETERSLRESRARFEAIALNSPAIMCLKDMDGRYIFANKKFEEVHGLSQDQILGATVYDLFDKEIADPLFEHDMHIARTGVPDAREQVIAARGGRRIFMEVKFPITLPPDGSVAIGLIGTDITERQNEIDELHEARQAAEAADALLMDALDNMSDGIVIYDLENRLVLCNSRFREFYQYTDEETRPGTLFEDLIRYDLDKGLIADQVGDSHVGRRIGQRETEGGSLEIQLTDGRWLQIRDRRTSSGGTVSIQRDITQQKEAQEAARQSEATLKAVIDTTPAIINVKDRDGRFLLCNPAQASFYGTTPDELRGKLLSEVADPEYVEQTIERDRQILETGAPMLGFEDTSFDLQGSLSTWYTTKVPLKGPDGAVSGILTISHDITRRKDEEIALIAAKEVAEAEVTRQREAVAQAEKMSALGSLLANVAHELNNPLSVVIGQADILREIVEDEKILKRVERMKSAADRSAAIVKTFLATVRQQPPERSGFSALQPLTDALATAEFALKTTGVELKQTIHDGLPDLFGDPGQIGQVLANLITNAQQAVAECSQPRVLEVSVQSVPLTGEVVYTVSDNGPGVPEDLRGRVFEPFFTTKPEGSGTGIGLSIAHNIVAAHGGSLVLAPKGENGSSGARFEMRLPVFGGEESAAVEPAPPSVEPDPPASNMRVLVVDDESDVGETVADHLSTLGYDCSVAENGEAALALIGDHEFAFVLSDIRMPVLDGPGLYREAATRWPGIEKRIGFITGDTLSPAASKFLAESNAPTIDKPFTRDDLKSLIERVLAD
ncbi:MAG: PAS domain S-box protein [Pseudomonadota bacterium]